MGGDALVVVFLKPEISTGFFKFSPSEDNDEENSAPSSIPGVSAVEAAFLMPNGHVTTTVIERIKDQGFEIVDRRMNQLTKEEARHLFSYELQYRFDGDEQVFGSYLNSITSGPTLALVLKLPAALALGDANAAIKQWIELAGDWDPVVARKKALAASTPHDRWPLRALCGLNSIQNGISSSPHVCCSRRERFFLLPPAMPKLERATIVLLPSFHSNLTDGKDILLSIIEREVQAIIVENFENYNLSDEEIVTLCGLNGTIDEKTRENIVQLAGEVIGDTGVEVFVLEGLDLSYTLRSAVGPANVEFAKCYFPGSVRAHLPSKLPSVELPTELHPDEAADDDALGFESGLFLSFDSKLNFGKASVDEKGIPIEFTLGLIKPNAACKREVVAEVLHMINLFGFTVERQRRLLLSRDQAAAFYAEHRGKPFFETLLRFMTSGEIVALHLSRPHAIKSWRALMGPTNSIKARETYPWTLRARFGVDGTQNATHGSDSTTSAARELNFFFGNSLSPSSTSSKLSNPDFVSSQTVAQRPIVLPGTAEISVEKILTQGLKELMEKKLSDPVDACRWLGEWLVMYRNRGLDEAPEICHRPQTSAHSTKAKITITQSSQETKSVAVRKVVAITLDSNIDKVLRSEIFIILRRRLKEARYEIVDVATEMENCVAIDATVANIVKSLKECGRHRCVLFGCENLAQSSVFHREFKIQAPSDWQINFEVHLELNNDSPVMTHSLEYDIPVLHFSVPSPTLQSNVAFEGLFHAVFDPSNVLLEDPDKIVPVGIWTAVAKHYGFVLLTFDGFIANLKTSNDNSEEARQLLQLVRSGANVAPKLILTTLRRIILGSLPGSNTIAQRFMLLGFPWLDIPATALEQAIGQPQSVLFVKEKRQKLEMKTMISSLPVWTTAFRKKGLVKRIWIDSSNGVDENGVRSAVHSTLAPVIGCFLGKCTQEEQLESLQIMAKAQGFIWIESTNTPSVQKLRELLLRIHAGREKFLLYGYPHTATQATDFLNIVGAPQFVLHDSSSASPVAEELLAVFNAQPAIMQLDLTGNAQSSNGLAKLRSTLFRKQVVAVVGSVDTLNASQLRDVVAVLGYDVLDLRQNDHQKDDEHERLLEFERRVQAVQAPRCLLIGTPETPSFYHALEAHIGCAMHKILILQHVQVRIRIPDAMEDGDSDAYSDEEQTHLEVEENGSDSENLQPVRSGVKWSKVMKALSPQLSQLLQTFATSTTSSISIDVIGFFENNSSRIVQDISARLRPQLFGVVGHPYSFYQTATRCVCRRNSIGFVDLSRVSSSFEALEALENLVATTAHSVYCLDGFPRSSLPDAIAPSRSTVSSTPRHVAQQLWELDRRLGPFSTLVHFTTALGVLDERTPEHISRRMLDLAQDALEMGSADLLRWFTTEKKHQMTSAITCDQTLDEAQVELQGVLQRLLRPSRPTIKQK